MNFKDFKNTYCPITPIKTLDFKINGWNSESIVFNQVIEKIQPKNILEVGSWLGASAIYMASLIKSDIICIDTFLGSNEALWSEQRVDLTRNFSNIFDQFCANITSKKLNNQISPLPMTSSSAAELLSKLQVTADLVYIDAGHRYREVYSDLEDYWPLTNKVLIGDDYSARWPEVIMASNDFASKHNLELQVLDSKFLIFR